MPQSPVDLVGPGPCRSQLTGHLSLSGPPWDSDDTLAQQRRRQDDARGTRSRATRSWCHATKRRASPRTAAPAQATTEVRSGPRPGWSDRPSRRLRTRLRAAGGEGNRCRRRIHLGLGVRHQRRSGPSASDEREVRAANADNAPGSPGCEGLTDLPAAMSPRQEFLLEAAFGRSTQATRPRSKRLIQGHLTVACSISAPSPGTRIDPSHLPAGEGCDARGCD